MHKVPENPSKNRTGEFSPLVVVSSLIAMLYITSNVLAVKIIRVGSISLFDAGTITFPLAYMLSDVLSEIWGYKTARKVIILSFALNILFMAFTTLGMFLPYPGYMETTQDAFVQIFSYVPRIVFSSLAAFLSGGLMNAKVLVKMRDKSKGGKHLWLRTISSSLVGYLFDTVLFVLLAFWGTVPAKDIISMIVVQYFAKAAIEALLGTPLAYLTIGYIRKNYGIEKIQQD